MARPGKFSILALFLSLAACDTVIKIKKGEYIDSVFEARTDLTRVDPARLFSVRLDTELFPGKNILVIEPKGDFVVEGKKLDIYIRQEYRQEAGFVPQMYEIVGVPLYLGFMPIQVIYYANPFEPRPEGYSKVGEVFVETAYILTTWPFWLVNIPQAIPIISPWSVENHEKEITTDPDGYRYCVFYNKNWIEPIVEEGEETVKRPLLTEDFTFEAVDGEMAPLPVKRSREAYYVELGSGALGDGVLCLLSGTHGNANLAYAVNKSGDTVGISRGAQ